MLMFRQDVFEQRVRSADLTLTECIKSKVPVSPLLGMEFKTAFWAESSRKDGGRVITIHHTPLLQLTPTL